MLSWLHSLTNLAVFGALGALPTMIVVLATQLAQGLGISRNAEREMGATEAFKAIAATAGFVAAFSLALVQYNFHTAEETASREAATAIALDRVLLRYDEPATTAIRPLLWAYCDQIIREEWKLLSLQGRGPRTDAALAQLSRAARGVDATSPRQVSMLIEMQRLLDLLGDQRETRITTSTTALPNLFWATLLSLMALMIGLAGLSPPNLHRAITQGGIMASVATLASLLVTIDEPFIGETVILPNAMRKALALMATLN